MFLTSQIMGQNLDDHRWERRILIVCAPEKTNSHLETQMKEFEFSDSDLKDRKMVIYEVIGDVFRLEDFVDGKKNEQWNPKKDRFDKIRWNKNEFGVFLIGLDGGIKLRRNAVLPKEELFRIIDAMPMRIGEMRSKRKN